VFSVQLGDSSGIGWLNITPGPVYGRGNVLPRLSFQLVARTPREKMQVQIHQLHAELRCANEALGVATVTGLWPSFGDCHFSIDVPASRQALSFISEQFRGDTLDLKLVLSGWLYVLREADPDDRKVMSAPDPGEWGFVSVGRGSTTELQVRVSRGDWLKQVLEPIGTLEYVLTEIALPKGAAGSTFSKALAHLREAERQYALGHDASVFSYCKAMTEAMPGWPKDIFSALVDRQQAEILDALLKDAVDYFNRGRHVAQEGEQKGEFPIDHRAAWFALTLSKVLFAEIAETVSAPHL
jgi:hypothetical protein